MSKKMSILVLFIFGWVAYFFFIRVLTEEVKTNQELVKREILILKEAKTDFEKMVPDSIKREAHAGSYTLMYAEPNSNDYWEAKHHSWAGSDFLKKTYPSYQKLDSMIQERQKDLGIKNK